MEMTALDLMKMLPQMSSNRMVNDPRAATQGLFSLICSIETFAELVDNRYEGVAHALTITANRLYDTLRQNTLNGASRWIMNPDRVSKAYQRFENVFLSVEQLSDQFGKDWRVIVAWRKVQDQFRPIKPVLVSNCRYQPLR